MSGSQITVHKVEPGVARVGCDPRGVQVFYKESTTSRRNPNFVYLGDLLKGRGFTVRAGDVVSGTPLQYLCVTRPGGVVTRDEVLGVLASDPEIDLSNVNRPEGNRGE